MRMRKTGAWQRAPDDRILEYLRDHDVAGAHEIARDIQYPITVHRVRRRLRVLAQASYAAPLDDDYDLFELTVWGQLYLEGEVRADLLVPEPDERREGYVLG
ncbi:repressor phrH2 [Halarchaeum sp. P4]|uniref:repressor phrH2 n=1 Tax=Halarchaeum sp. P4 TaxID=3421639 RepID=UPI003EBF18B3